MGIYIKGIELPKDCDSCGIVKDCPLWYCTDVGARHPECPLTEVKEPHGELIDKDKVIDAIFRKLSVKSKENLLPSEKTIFSKVVKAETVIERSD